MQQLKQSPINYLQLVGDDDDLADQECSQKRMSGSTVQTFYSQQSFTDDLIYWKKYLQNKFKK